MLYKTVGRSNRRMKRRASLLAALMGGTALAGLASQPVSAQDDEETDEPIDQVIVTVTRRATDILDVPYNITAVSGSDIAASVTLDNAELLRSVPGVGLIDQGPRNGAQFNSIRIRGLNVDSSALGDFAVPSVATVATYINETPVYANLALIDLNRVEVLRGPQGTLYGSGALGGTVKYHLNRPDFREFEGFVGGDLSHVKGSDSVGYAVRGVLNIPMSDEFAIRANVYWRDYPGITDYVNLYVLDANGVPVQPNGLFDRGFDSTEYRVLEDADTFDSLYARISARWEPADWLEMNATFLYQDDETGGRRDQSQGANGIGEPYDRYENGAVIVEPSEREFYLASLEAEVDLGFATLTSATSYYDNDGSSETDNTGFYANSFAFFYYNYPRPIDTAERTFFDRAFVQELRLVSNTEGRFDYVAGLFFQDQERSLTQISDLIGFEAFADALFPPIDFVFTDNLFTFDRREDFQDFAVFGELTFHLTDNLHVTGGLRYFTNEFDVLTFVRVGVFNTFNGEQTTPFSNDDDDLLYKVNIALDFGDDDLLFATVSEGYRRGGNNGVPTIGRFANDPGWVTYNSDSVTNFEVGVKGRMQGIRYDVSAFYIDWNDPQLNTSAPVGSFFAVINGDEARTMGFEAQFSGTIGENINYAFGYAFVDAELTADLFEPININTGLPTLVAVDGAPLPGIPKHALSVAVDHTLQLGNGFFFTTRVDGFYQSSTQNVLDEDVVQSTVFSGFSIWDLTGTVSTDRWSVSIFVKNIFNSEGTTGAFTEDAFGPNPVAEFFGSNSRQFIALPRTIGLSAALNF